MRPFVRRPTQLNSVLDTTSGGGAAPSKKQRGRAERRTELEEDREPGLIPSAGQIKRWQPA